VTTRTTSTTTSSARRDSRSAATPPSSTLTSRPTLYVVDTRPSSVGPPPSSITCQTTATIHIPLANSDTAIEATR
jgi:hypothetical protein